MSGNPEQANGRLKAVSDSAAQVVRPRKAAPAAPARATSDKAEVIASEIGILEVEAPAVTGLSEV
jgi:hypothetical protein